ncbi:MULTISPECIES: DNA polymerase III subunit delta' [unclassified Pseudoalteromonas]|uniref:DNA polymerase III subunit delta' n=1 Tax=unclassified Pseudoalteromonas TaxID=194690 RepID=UPI0030148092
MRDTPAWHQASLDYLNAAKNSGRLHHAQLISGKVGVGKALLAEHLSEGLLCLQPNGITPCGQCKSCSLNRSGNHPDKLLVASEGKSIGVDEIREISDFANHSAQQGGNKVALIEQGHLMTHSAANALLKTLEEPNPGRYLIITSDDDSKLPATILSRCNKVVMHSPTHEQAQQWLTQQGIACDYPWFSEFARQPLMVAKWHQQERFDEITSLYQAAIQLTPESADVVEKILLKNNDLSEVFARFVLNRVQKALMHDNSIDFSGYQSLVESVHRFMYEQKNVLGLNQHLSISKLLFILQKLL